MNKYRIVTQILNSHFGANSIFGIYVCKIKSYHIRPNLVNTSEYLPTLLFFCRPQIIPQPVNVSINTRIFGNRAG